MYNFTKRLEKNKSPEEIINFCKSNVVDKYFCKKRITLVKAYLRSIEGFIPRTPAKTNRFDIPALVKLGFKKRPSTWSAVPPLKGGSSRVVRRVRKVRKTPRKLKRTVRTRRK